MTSQNLSLSTVMNTKQNPVLRGTGWIDPLPKRDRFFRTQKRRNVKAYKDAAKAYSEAARVDYLPN